MEVLCQENEALRGRFSAKASPLIFRRRLKKLLRRAATFFLEQQNKQSWHAKQRLWPNSLLSLTTQHPRVLQFSIQMYTHHSLTIYTDFDPEEEPPQDDSDSDVGVEDNTAAAREHYVDVGKSKLRKRDIVPLGPRYEGFKVSRDAVTGDDDDEDDPFSKGFDEEESEDNVDGALDGSASEGEDEDVSEEEDEEMQDGDESPATDVSDEDEEEDDDDEDEDEDEATEDKAELRKMLAEEQKSVAAGLSQAAKQDAEKGRAVKTQRSTFDSLLNTRIKLQKALIGTNTLSGIMSESAPADETTEEAFRAAETAAFTLWSSLNSLRETLESNRTGHKRKRPDFDIDTPTADLWSHMRAQEAATHPHRTAILEKWSAKARDATAIAPRNRLNNSTATQTIVDVLQEQLHGDRLLKRARTPRSCAPLQLSRAAKSAAAAQDDAIYDDADFYGILLQSLLEQRSADSVAASASNNIDVNAGFQMRREAKTKKAVDTKASKGRKLRYTVHEKLQNFMAPEDRGVWGERAMDELFGSLFGARMGLGEDVDEEEEEEERGDEEEAGLMLFRS